MGVVGCHGRHSRGVAEQGARYCVDDTEMVHYIALMGSESRPILRRIAARVRARRTLLGLTARELADRAGLSPRFISQLENGQANIAIGRLDAVAGVMGIEVADLVASEEWMLKSVPMVFRESRRPNREYGARRREWPVVLLGMRGAGKSTIGGLLADSLMWPMVEVDEKIERMAGLDLSSIFTVHGEDYYRRLEAACIGELLGRREAMVIAPSGGVVRNGPAFELIRRRCITVWLRATPEEHMARVLGQGDQRPTERRDAPMEELRSMLAQREPLYSQADLVLDTSGGSPEAAAEELQAALDALREERDQLERG